MKEICSSRLFFALSSSPGLKVNIEKDAG